LKTSTKNLIFGMDLDPFGTANRQPHFVLGSILFKEKR